MGDGTSGSYRWEGPYPALSPEAAKRLNEKLGKLQDALTDANKRIYQLEQQNEKLEAALKVATRTKEGYLQIASRNCTFQTPQPVADWYEPFSK